MVIARAKPTHNKAPPARPSLADLAHGPEAFRLLVEAVLDYAIFLIGPEGRVLTWNLGAERITGYAAGEIIGGNFSLFYPPEDIRAGLPDRVLRETARLGRYEGQGWRVRKDGSRFWADVAVTALHDELGGIYGFAKVTRDMTEARAAEERELQLAVEREARIAAEEGIRALDRFLSIASARGGNATHVPGMGLGLFISREIVALHGDQISAESAGAGMGTTFVVTLPAEPPRTHDRAA